MSDVNLNPPFSSNVHSRACRVAAYAGVKYGAVVVASGSSSAADVATTTSAGATGVMGVVQSHGDPNNSDLFANGDVIDVRDEGDAEILVLGSVSYVRGEALVTSTTAGVAKKRASETTADIIGYVLQDVTTGTNPQLISCRLAITRIP